MSTTVRVPTYLQALTDGTAELSATGDTVAEVMDDVATRHPHLRERLFDESGELRRFVNIYLNDEDVRFLAGLETAVPDGARLAIVPAIAGG